VGSADSGGIEHRHHVAGHVGHRERAIRPAAAPGAPVVHQDEPETAPQRRQHRLPAGTVESHALDQGSGQPALCGEEPDGVVDVAVT
jgi:hypothetical protein